MRLVIFRGGASSVSDAGSGCFIEYRARPSGPTPDVLRAVSLASYDTASRTILAGAVFAGPAAERCQFHATVPRL